MSNLSNYTLNIKISTQAVRFMFMASCLFVLLIPLFFHASVADAASTTYTVSKTADTNDGTCDSDCSLREAIAAANANAGLDTINFNIPTSDGGYTAPSGSTQGYFTITTSTALNLTDDSGILINGYSQTGASRNTVSFGGTLDTVLKIRLFNTSNVERVFYITGDNNHITGLNIAGNSVDMVNIDSSSNDWIEGNFFGTDITGTSSSVGGTITTINGSNSFIIGTNGDGISDSSERNLFLTSGTNNGAVSATSNNGVIAGNYIGVNKTGRVCGTTTMNREQIIFGVGNDNNRVGTNFDGISDIEESNIIACIGANVRALVRINGTNGKIQGNYIGTNPQGDELKSSVAEPGIGDTGTAATGWVIKKNTIAHLGGVGIFLSCCTPTSNQNKITQNSIFSNSGIGIDLTNDGHSSNDAGDVDTGNNDLMNYPVITKAGLSSNGHLIVQANLDFKTSEAPYTLEFFDNSALDSSGYGPGQTYIGSVNTSSTGNNVILIVPITGTAPTTISKITSTATNTSGSTSEFSAVSTDATLYSTVSSGSVIINNGDSNTTSSDVSLALNTVGEFNAVSQMKISNTSDLSGASYESYAPTKAWTLASGSGTKTVYVKFKDSSGNESGVYSDSINLTTIATPTPKDSPSPTAPATPMLTNIGTLIARAGGKHYYYTGHRPTFAGTAPAGMTITFVIHSDPITLTTTTDNSGRWSVKPTIDIPDGDHTVTLTATNSAGTVSAPFTFSLGINTGLATTGDSVPLVTFMSFMGLLGFGYWLKRRMM